jgi:hypothetical protein
MVLGKSESLCMGCHPMYANSQAQLIERIRLPKREQVQFLFPSLGLHCVAGCMHRGSVGPPCGKGRAGSSKMICRFNTHLPFGGA